MSSPNVEVAEVKAAFSEFSGYSYEQREIMRTANQRFAEQVADYRHALSTAQFYGENSGTFPGPLGKPFKILSKRTDKDYRWFVVSNMFATKSFAPIVTNLEYHRRFVTSHVQRLKLVNSLAQALTSAATRIKTSFCDTEVDDNGNVLQFSGQIFPIQLLAVLAEEKEKVVPISSLPTLCGKLLGFTGFHGGGKTQTSLAILVNTWLFQSGIPPLGTGLWRQNVKEAIGGVFIDTNRRRSTCQLLLEKMTHLINEVSNYDPHRVIVILDELGTGTQEVSGIELGQDVLANLAGRGVSTLFTTQIQQVAEYARDQLGAQCFKFDAKHKIEEGIGDGGMSELRKRTGLDKALGLK